MADQPAYACPRQHFSDNECEQFNGSKPENQNCKRYRIVLEPKKHDVTHVDDRRSQSALNLSLLGRIVKIDH